MRKCLPAVFVKTVVAEQIYADLARSRQQIAEGRGIPMEKALKEIGRKHGFYYV